MKRHLAVTGTYLALTLLMLWPLPILFTKAIPGDGFDGWQNYWNLWWVSRALLEEHTSPFYTRYLYHPQGVSLLFHTLNIPNGLLAMPFLVLFGPVVAYNSIVLVSSVLSGYGAFLLALKVTKSRQAAFIAGIVYAFSPFRFAHLLGHMQVFSTEWIPFFILALFRAVRGGPLLLPILFLSLSSLCDWYQALYLALFTALYLAWLAWKKHMNLRMAFKIGAIWGFWGIALSPLLVPMLLEMLRYRFMFTPPEHALLLSADLLAFITPSEFHPLWGKWASKVASNFTASLSERTVFLGYVPLALALVAWKRRERGVYLWLITGLFFLLMALGPYLHVAGKILPLPLPYAFLRSIPLVAMARSVSRFSLMGTLSLGVMAAMGTKQLARRFYPALAFLILLEYWPAPYPFTPPHIHEFYWRLAQEPGDFAVLNLPMNWDRPQYLLYQTIHQKRLVSGYISREDPRTLVKRVPVLQHLRQLKEDIIKVDLAQVAPSVMAYLGVKYAILEFYQMPGGEEREKTLAFAYEAFGSSEIVHRDEGLTAYRLLPPERPVPFLFLGEGWGELNDSHRALGKRSTLFLHAPEPLAVSLLIEVSSTCGGRLKVRAGPSFYAFEIPPQERTTLSFSVKAETGDNLIELEWEPASRGEKLLVWSLRLAENP